jgi:FkbM family methyltransferase
MKLDRSEVYFVDIGANLGTFSLGVAAAGFKVIAIEAMSVNQFALSTSLCANIGMSEAVTLLSVALGKESGQCTVFSATHNVLDGTIRCGEAEGEELLRQGMVKRQDVDVVRLDNLLEDWLPALKNRVGALKMDTEGFEPWVINGGKKFFSDVRPRFLQLEVSSMSDAATGISSLQMLEALAGLGYEIREEAFSRPVRAADMTQKSANEPGNVYLYARPNETASEEAIERLEFDRYADEYKEIQKMRLDMLNSIKVPST